MRFYEYWATMDNGQCVHGTIAAFGEVGAFGRVRNMIGLWGRVALMVLIRRRM